MRVDCDPLPTSPPLPETHLLADGAEVANHPLRFLLAASVLDKYFFFCRCVWVCLFFFRLPAYLSVCARGPLLGLIWSVALGIKREEGDGGATQQHTEHRAPSRDPAGV